MKYLIASDIHGSLKYGKALIDAFKREGADKILLLGDVLYHGPRNDLPRDYAPKEVLAMLNAEKNIYMKESEYPGLKKHVGKHLIVTDGTTLLGADNKAGVAEILSAAEFLLKTRMNHATLKIAFTPDEEIGRGADKFDIEHFGADYGYTVDGGPVGELEYENFNAADGRKI